MRVPYNAKSKAGMAPASSSTSAANRTASVNTGGLSNRTHGGKRGAMIGAASEQVMADT